VPRGALAASAITVLEGMALSHGFNLHLPLATERVNRCISPPAPRIEAHHLPMRRANLLSILEFLGLLYMYRPKKLNIKVKKIIWPCFVYRFTVSA
jgi:hypothetical protein